MNRHYCNVFRIIDPYNINHQSSNPTESLPIVLYIINYSYSSFYTQHAVECAHHYQKHTSSTANSKHKVCTCVRRTTTSICWFVELQQVFKIWTEFEEKWSGNRQNKNASGGASSEAPLTSRGGPNADLFPIYRLRPLNRKKSDNRRSRLTI